MIRFKSYRKRRSYAQAVIIILLAIVLTATSPFYIRPLFSAILYPFQVGAVAIWKTFTGIPSFIGQLNNLSKDNALLQKENKELQTKQLVFNELKEENMRLRQAAQFKTFNPYSLKLVSAQVVSRSSSAWFSLVQINKGSRAGIKKDMVIVSELGLVGRVIEVSLFSSKVLLITSADSSIAATDFRNRDSGVVVGGRPEILIMKYVGVEGDIKVGDEILTSHISTIFPSGIPVGRVFKATKKEHDLFYHIEIKPAVDFSKLEEVFIVI